MYFTVYNIKFMICKYTGYCQRSFIFKEHHSFKNNTFESRSQINKLCFVAGATHHALIY